MPSIASTFRGAVGACGLHLLLLAAPSPLASAEAPDATLKLKAAHVADESFAWHRALERFRDVARARSNNTLDVQIYPNGLLGTEKDYVQYMVQGVLDVATVSAASASPIAREASFLDLLYLWKDHDHWQRAMDGDVGQKLGELLEKSTAKGGNPGFHVLGYWGGSEMHVASRAHGYETMKELAGAKIRTQDSVLQQEMWKLSGAFPVVVPYPAALNGLTQGVIEGVDGTLASFVNMKLYDVAPHISLTGHMTSVRPLFMSGHTWKKLSPTQQKAVVEAAKEATALARTLEWQQAQEAETQLRAKSNVKFYTFKEKQLMREQTQGIRQRVAAETGLQPLLEAVDAGWSDKAKKK
jgi:TRAP-type C4-dicarboxylate transport system substrate-binding protein